MRQKEFRAVAKQILPDLPGWKLKGPLLIWPPVDHTLRAVCFEPSGFDKQGFYLNLFILPLCVRREYVSFEIGERLGFSWNSNDPQLVPKLLRALREEAIPYLHDLDTPQDVIVAIRERRGLSGRPHIYQALAYLLVLYGDMDEAVGMLDHLLEQCKSGFYAGLEWAEQIAAEAQMLRGKLLENPEEARRMLREWEDESRRNLKLEEFTSAAMAASSEEGGHAERLRRLAAKEGL